MQLGNSSWKIGQMLHYVHCNDAVEISVFVGQSFLTIGNRDRNRGKTPSYFACHIFPNFHAMIFLAAKFFKLQMTTRPGANFEGPKMIQIRNMTQWITMVELLNCSVTARQ